jgi:cytochrome c oxidase subunit III
MSLFSRLTQKSWQTPGIHGLGAPEDYRPSAGTVGTYVYMAVATGFFGLIVAAYVARMGSHGLMAHSAGTDWRAMPEPPLLWINTLILLASSLAWEGARRAARNFERLRTRRMTLIGAALGLAFLAGQLLLWQQYRAAGYYLAVNPSIAFFYLLTAVHGLHLAGGLVACARAVGQSGSNADEARAFRNIGLCAVYWHFLLLVWLLLAGLLVLT